MLKHSQLAVTHKGPVAFIHHYRSEPMSNAVQVLALQALDGRKCDVIANGIASSPDDTNFSLLKMQFVFCPA